MRMRTQSFKYSSKSFVAPKRLEFGAGLFSASRRAPGQVVPPTRLARSTVNDDEF